MKKYLISMMAVATALFMASCTKEAQLSDGTDNGDMVTATFSIQTPDGLATRAAIGDGTTVDRVKCVVYDAAGAKMDLDQTLEIKNGEKKATYSIRLVKGQAYRVAFFAYNEAAKAYNVDDLKNIQILDGQNSNVEGRDAFTAYTDITAKETMSPINETVTLYRPFAQLNIGAYEDDIKAAKAAGVDVAKSQVVVSDVYTAFSAFDNAFVGETSEMTFAMNAIPTEKLKVKADKDNDGKFESSDEYTYLALNYLLVGDKGTEKSLTNVTFKWENADGSKTNTPVTTFTDIPVQRNYRTNIIGHILTNPATFNIVIDPIFDGEITIENGTEKRVNVRGGDKLYETLADALKAGETDIVLGNGEHTLTNVKSNVKISGVSTDAKININTPACNGADVTFENVTLVVPNTGYVGVQHVGNMIANGCVIEGQIFCYSAPGKKTTFNDCIFEQEDKENYNIWTYGSNVDFNNCVFNSAGKAALIYTEGGDVWETVTFSDCKFYASQKVDDKAAIEIDSSLNPCEVNIENCTAEGFDLGSVSRDPLFNLKKGELGVNCKINVVYANGGVKLDVATGNYEISTAEGMFWFANEVNANGNTFAGKIVKLAADIDLNNQDWEPIGQTGATQFLGTFDGQEHTISNLNIDSENETGGTYSSALFGWIERHGENQDYLMAVKNVKVDGAVVKGHHNVAVIAGYLIGTVENCHVTDAKVTCTHANNDACGGKAGVIAGIAAEAKALITGCTAANSTVKAGRDAGQIVGACIVGKVENCSATDDVTVSATGDCAKEANIRNELIGRTN